MRNTCQQSQNRLHLNYTFKSQHIHSPSQHFSVVINHYQVNSFSKTIISIMYSLIVDNNQSFTQ
jgi:hypothetical protein